MSLIAIHTIGMGAYLKSLHRAQKRIGNEKGNGILLRMAALWFTFISYLTHSVHAGS